MNEKEEVDTNEVINHLFDRINNLESQIHSLKAKPKAYTLSGTEKRMKAIHDLLGGEMFIKVFIGSDKQIRIHEVERMDDHIQNINHSLYDKTIRDLTG